MSVESALHFAESLALSEYITNDDSDEAASRLQGNISAALASVASFSEELSRRDPANSRFHEQLLQFAAKLLYYHASHG